MKKIRKAVLPVAGLGTRFLPATKAIPKEMLPVVDRPLIQHVVDEARVIVDQEEENIVRADGYLGRGYRVCLFIHSNMLYKEKQSNGSATPDHWVVLTSRVRWGSTMIGSEAKRTIAFTIYTWGEGHRAVPQTGALTVDDFLDNYYGFVAAKY